MAQEMQLKKWANMLEFKAENHNVKDHRLQEVVKLHSPKWTRFLIWHSEVIWNEVGLSKSNTTHWLTWTFHPCRDVSQSCRCPAGLQLLVPTPTSSNVLAPLQILSYTHNPHTTHTNLKFSLTLYLFSSPRDSLESNYF